MIYTVKGCTQQQIKKLRKAMLGNGFKEVEYENGNDILILENPIKKSFTVLRQIQILAFISISWRVENKTPEEMIAHFESDDSILCVIAKNEEEWNEVKNTLVKAGYKNDIEDSEPAMMIPKIAFSKKIKRFNSVSDAANAITYRMIKGITIKEISIEDFRKMVL